jgi:dephospho-CoA kinase
VIAPGTPGAAAVLEAFGTLDRAELAAIVFADPAARGRLNAIVHPLVAEAAAAVHGDVVVHDVPLLVETGMAPLFDVVVVVEAPAELRLARSGRPDAAARMAAQATDAERRAVADHVIVNDGDLDALMTQVDRVWRAIVC